jgi:hypothetical protein
VPSASSAVIASNSASTRPTSAGSGGGRIRNLSGLSRDRILNMHLIPSRVIAGRVALLLRTYEAYIVGNASGLLGTAMGARSGTVRAVARSSA